jgi:phage terminase large subunit-like protein
MEDYGWAKASGEVEMINQNAETLNNAILLTEAEFKAQNINYNENPVDRWCLSNSCIQVNNKRQALIIKTENSNKIDGAVTLVSLYEMWRRYRSDMKTLEEKKENGNLR